MLLAGDIGGTKVKLALFSPERGPRQPLREGTFPSENYPSLKAIVDEYLAEVGDRVEKASFGVAGPILGSKARVTNLTWLIDAAELRRRYGWNTVRLINDLEAIANAVPILEPDDLAVVNRGEAAPHGAIAVVAPGTGLGEAFLTWDGERYRAHPSEGGHTDFGPTSELEIKLLHYLQERYEHISYERICSGIGLPNIYDCFRDLGVAEEPPWLAERLAAARDPTPEIVRAALDEGESCPLCVAVLDTFVSVLGAEAGNMALKVLATGGVYLAGGISPKILPKLQDGAFMAAFIRKGRFRDLLHKIPISVVINEKAALLGAARYGLWMM